MSRRNLFWWIVLGGLALDQSVKLWIQRAIPPHGGFDGLPWPGVFEITHVQNEGIAFGLFQGYGVLLAPVAVGIALLAASYSRHHPKESAWIHAAMALLASGALGNLIDRLVHGKVTDMFQIRVINFPVFNVADICITAAAAILILKWSIEAVPHQKSEEEAAPAEEPALVEGGNSGP